MILKFRTLALSALTLTALSATSCIDRNEEKEKVVDVTAETVSTELTKIWDFSDEKSSPLSMGTGEFALIHQTQQIETMPPYLYMQEGLNIVAHNLLPDPDNAKKIIHEYKFGYETLVYSTDGNSQQSTRAQERYYRTDKPETPAAATMAQKSAELELSSLTPAGVSPLADEADDGTDNDLKMELGFEKIAMMPVMCVSSPELSKLCQEQLGAESCTRTCSNLEVTEELADAPELMSKQPNCGGLPNCKMRIKRVKFNTLLTINFKNAVQTQKRTYVIAVSPDLPFLGRVTEFCMRGLMTYNSGKILVNLCSKLANYRPPTTP